MKNRNSDNWRGRRFCNSWKELLITGFVCEALLTLLHFFLVIVCRDAAHILGRIAPVLLVHFCNIVSTDFCIKNYRYLVRKSAIEPSKKRLFVALSPIILSEAINILTLVIFL